MASSKIYNMAIKIAGKVDPSLYSATKKANGQISSMGNAAGLASKVGVAALAAITTATAAVAVKSVQAAAEYETQMANVATLLDGTVEQVAARTAELSKDILSVSNVTGVATADLTDGMYQVVSAFGDSKDAVNILETAAKSAAAGNATTTDSINLLSAVTKGYGDTSSKAVQQAADLAFETVKLGQTTFPELASSMGKVIPLASTLGVEQEQLFGAMATLTGVTGGTAEVTTQLKATMQGFLSPSANMAKSLKKMGYSSGQALLESEGLQGALEVLKGSVGGNELAFAGLFSSVEAQTAVLSLAGTQAENLTSKTAAMYEATGAANAAFETQTDTLAYTISSIKNLGSNFMTQVGQQMLPIIKDIAEQALPEIQAALPSLAAAVGNVIQKVSTAIGFVYKHRTLFTALAIGIGVLAVAMSVAAIAQAAMTTSQAAAIPVAAALSVATTGLSLPFLAIAAAIAAAVAIGYVLYKNWDTIKAKALELWESLSAFAAGVKESFVAAFGSLVGIVKEPINTVIGLLNYFIGKVNTISIGPLPDWSILGEYAGESIGFNIPQIPKLAQGGIATAATLAEVGEGGEPEAIMPLSKLADLLDGFNPSPRSSGNGKTSAGGIVYAPVQHFHGTVNKKDVEEANAVSFSQFKTWYKQMKDDERRKSFA